MELRRAGSEEERRAIYRLRHAVYVAELGKDVGVTPRDGELTDDDDRDAGTELLYLQHEDQVVGTVRLHALSTTRPLPRGYDHPTIRRAMDALGADRVTVLTRFMVLRAHRGGEGGRRLLEAAFDRLAELGAQLVFGSCEAPLVRFYQRLGFRCHAEGTAATGTYLVPIVFVLGDLEHLRRLGSPLHATLAARTFDPELVRRAREAVGDASPARTQEFDADRFWEETSLLLDGPAGQEGALQGLAADQLERLLARGTLVSCQRGERILTTGQSGRALYVVLEGTLEIHRRGRAAGLAGPGEVLGEVGFFHGLRRTADVRVASETARLLLLHEAIVERLLADDPPLAARFLLNLSRSLALKLATAPIGEERDG